LNRALSVNYNLCPLRHDVDEFLQQQFRVEVL